MNYTISTDQILWICSIAGALWGLWKIVKELRKPSCDLKATVAKHTEYLDNDNRRMKEYESTNHMILRCLLVIINHEITGNGIETMKQARDDLQKFLVEK